MGKDGERERWSWKVFMACMFIGIGVGLLFDTASAGTLIGMGTGFILGSLVKLEKKLEVNVPRGLGGAAIALMGVLFIIGGLELLGFIPKEHLTQLIALGLI